MAYAVDLRTRTCQAPECHDRATHEVHDRFGDVLGVCCERHAAEMVAELKVQGR